MVSKETIADLLCSPVTPPIVRSKANNHQPHNHQDAAEEPCNRHSRVIGSHVLRALKAGLCQMKRENKCQS